jgi:DNA-binding NarL/FixJ family response regulator
MKIAIVEDNTITRKTLKLLLSGQDSIQSVETYSSAEEFLLQPPDSRPDILMVDLDLPGMHGTELIQNVKKLLPDTEIIVHTVFEDRENVFSALKAGASGYVLKGNSPKELIDSLHSLSLGGAPMTPKIARKVLTEFQQTRADENPLSARESNIVRCIEQGLSYKEIAEQLFISPHTVHTHIKNIYEKLQSKSRREALKRAKEIGII